MNPTLHFKLKSDVEIIEDQKKEFLLRYREGELKWKKMPGGLRSSFSKLRKWSLEDELLEDHFDLPSFYFYIEKLKSLNLLSYSLFYEDKPLVNIEPMNEQLKIEQRKVDKKQKLKVSKFCYLHVKGEKLVLETPLTPAIIHFNQPSCFLLFEALVQERSIEDLCLMHPDLPTKLVDSFVSLLLSLNILEEELFSPIFEQWEFHDLLFHSKSRKGRNDNPFGGIYPFVDKIPPLPAVKPKISSKKIDLFKPDLKGVKTLLSVMEERRSVRDHDMETPLSIKDLGEFLYRCARIKEIIQTDKGELSKRPMPGGGAIYELEIYPLIHKCTGVEPGLYHYNPKEHALYIMESDEEKRNLLLEDACQTSGKTAFPQVLFLITSRFQRFSWKYRSMAYATSLKNVGVLYQTMYLVATDMDLAPCGLGGGIPDLFSETTGINYYEESTIGEFMLGSKFKS